MVFIVVVGVGRIAAAKVAGQLLKSLVVVIPTTTPPAASVFDCSRMGRSIQNSSKQDRWL